ncbi:AMSH-like ubiquitin thioesterase 2 isoform X2 [Aristolochia californica]
MSEVTSQHPSYLTYSTTEKLHHKKILEEFVKELKELKPLIRAIFFGISRNVEDEMEDSRSNGGNQVKCYISGEDKGPRQEWIPNHMYMVKSNNDQSIVYGEETGLASVVMADAGPDCSSSGSPSSTHLTSSRGCDIDCRPTPSVSCIHSLPEGAYGSLVNVGHWGQRHLKSSKSLVHDSSATKAMLDVHISARLMEDFLELARENTDKDLETCGVLGANLRNGTFYVTTLIIPKQESTSNSCQTLNEEEIYAIQDEQNLFPVGWIHTHPSQTCFMSSIDLHTHYSYQVMLPEAVAIVMAPTDTTRTSGIFRLTDPTGISTLKECQERGFHPHREPADGSPIYEECSDVYMNSNLRFEIIDLR